MWVHPIAAPRHRFPLYIVDQISLRYTQEPGIRQRDASERFRPTMTRLLRSLFVTLALAGAAWCEVDPVDGR
jgi:hypothetical protein